MNKNKLGLFLMLSLMLSALSAHFAAAAAEEPWDTVTKIITLQFMTNLGFSSIVDPFEGLIRFLLLILLFSVLFKGAELLKLGRNISIVLAAVISIISVIFIPGTVLIAAAASYATLVSVVLLGIPIFLMGFLYFMMKEHPWIRVAIMAILIFVLKGMESQLGLLSSGAGLTSVHFSGIITTVGSYITYVIYLAWALGIISLIQAISSVASGRPAEQMDLMGTAGHWWNKFKSNSRRQQTAAMNQYVEDRKEMELLENAGDALNRAKVAVETVHGSSEFKSRGEKNNIITLTEKIKNVLENARNEMRRVRSRTARTQKRFHNAIAELKKRKGELRGKEKDVERLEALESNILLKHKEVENNLADALAAYASKVVGPLSSINREVNFYASAAAPTWPLTVGGVLKTALDHLSTALSSGGDLDQHIRVAEAAEREALSDMNGATVEVQELLKWTPKESA